MVTNIVIATLQQHMLEKMKDITTIVMGETCNATMVEAYFICPQKLPDFSTRSHFSVHHWSLFCINSMIASYVVTIRATAGKFSIKTCACPCYPSLSSPKNPSHFWMQLTLGKPFSWELLPQCCATSFSSMMKGWFVLPKTWRKLIPPLTNIIIWKWTSTKEDSDHGGNLELNDLTLM